MSAPKVLFAIPSKSRPNGSVFKLLDGIDYKVFVEPEELDLYAEHNSVVDIRKDRQGIAYVRNFIVTYAAENGFDIVVMLDDDLSGFYVKEGNKSVKTEPRRVLNHLVRTAITFNKTITGLEYQQFVWSVSKPLSENVFVGCVEAIQVHDFLSKGMCYDAEVALKEDVDICLQAITKGGGVVRSNFFGFACPKMGSNAGGLQEAYQSKKDESSARKMLKKWPGLVRPMVKKDGSFDIKIYLK